MKYWKCQKDLVGGCDHLICLAEGEYLPDNIGCGEGIFCEISQEEYDRLRERNLEEVLIRH